MTSARQKRAAWRSRRGMLELDVLLNRFIDEAYAELDSSEQDDFDQLLEQTDVDLYAWFTGRENSDDQKLAALVDRIRRLAAP